MFKGKLIAASMFFRAFPLTEAMKMIKAHGFDEMEVTIAGTFTPHFLNLPDLVWEEMAEKAAEAAAIGVHVHAINYGAGYNPLDEAGSYRGHLNALRLAHHYGAKVVTFGCGAVAPGVDTIEGLKKIAEYLDRMSLIARNEFGIQLSVEAPHRCTISERMEQIQTYWAYMPERLGCTMDVAHITYTGASIARVLQLVGPRLAHVHLRDAQLGNSMIPYGEGKVDFAEVFRLLESCGYQGKCSLEYPGNADAKETAAAFEKGIAVLEKARKASAR